ncbi:MAG: CBS domain-containing protein [Chloroflexota bacterium]|nr:MAG: CBS domain-containing protein [Chloroflexota bacterium]
MRSGLKLARLFGINIYIDWSWIFIFLLVTWNLAAGVFPQIHPEWSLGLNIAIGLAASLLFFGSVLAHELAHSLVAKASGLPVRRITLFIFGGVSNIEREPPSPLTEFLISIVVPLTSLILGALFIVLGGASLMSVGTSLGNPTQALRNLDPLSTLLIWLGPINILLGIFNLIPGFPLDGGRVLRSILWAATNNLRTATRWATLVGQIVAWLFIIAGIAMAFGVRIPFFGTGIISGLWLAFIGWFLNNAASQSYQQVVVEDMLEGVPVSRLMRPNAPTVDPNIPVSGLVDQFIMGTDERAFPVVVENRLVGLVCLEDVRKVPRTAWDETQVGQIMTPADKLDIVNPREDANDALNKLVRRDIRQMPVVQNGQLVGMLRRRDIMRWLQLQSETSS